MSIRNMPEMNPPKWKSGVFRVICACIDLAKYVAVASLWGLFFVAMGVIARFTCDCIHVGWAITGNPFHIFNH